MKQEVDLSFAFEMFEVGIPLIPNSNITPTGFAKPTQMVALCNWLRKANVMGKFKTTQRNETDKRTTSH